MKSNAIDKPKTSIPSFFDNGWVEKFFNAPLDELFNFGKTMNVPAVNVTETNHNFQLHIAAPGLERKDFKVEADERLLTISAEREKEKEELKGRYNRREYNYNGWSRSFTLPENCDPSKIDASYKNGELKIVIPKKEVAAPKKAKSISVN